MSLSAPDVRPESLRQDERLADRRLLRVAWASAVALLAIGVLLGWRAEVDHRERAVRQAQVQADILAASVSAALAFDDRVAMGEYVAALGLNAEVAAAAVYDSAGRAVVSIHRRDAKPPPTVAGPPGAHFAGRRATVTGVVSERGQRLGEVYLRTVPESWPSVLGRHSGLALLSLLAVLLLGVVTAAASRLQARARLLTQSNARLVEAMDARGKAEEALRQSQKMEALGQLTGGIAHDFNNLLQIVQGAFELIGRKPGDPERVTAWSRNGLAAAERGASLTRQLLAFSRSQKLELRPFVVGELIADMRELLVRTLGADTTLEVQLEAADAAVVSDRTQLELAVLNLAINARDAMPDGGRLTIATGLRAVPPGDPLLETGDYVTLSVADTGEGMAPEVMERAFDPFFTTKGVGKGTGLGLSQVYGVARQAGGAAQIESRPGGGTAVTLLLRRSAAPSTPAVAHEAPQPVPETAAGRTVLVVDDEAALRELACETLELLGYRVLEADGGDRALDMLQTLRPDLLLLDYAMPGMNGAELARQARRRWPGLPIVFASGHADSQQVEAALGGEAPFLRKPFSMDALARVVGERLRAFDAEA